MGLFVTGTGTDVGKTVVSAWLCLHQGFHYWKPIQTGSVEGTDTDFIHHLGVACYPEAYIFQGPLSPHTAAKLEQRTISIDPILKQVPTHDQLLIEGAGGVLVPLNATHLMIDLIQRLKAPVIIVAHSGLGTLNHTLLTLEALRARKIEPLGIILNGPSNPNNRDSLVFYGKTQVLAELPPLDQCTAASLLEIPLPESLKQRL